MPKTRAAGQRPDASIIITARLRRLIGTKALPGETVDATLRRLFCEQGHRDVGKTIAGLRMLLGKGQRMSIRMSKALKAWIIGQIRGYETAEHAIIRLAGLSRKVKEGSNGR